jgi:hypothetical protein
MALGSEVGLIHSVEARDALVVAWKAAGAARSQFFQVLAAGVAFGAGPFVRRL